MLPILSFLVASTTAVGGVQLHSRAAQSIAVCAQSFSWMDNSKNISPCQIAASVDALCNNGNWIIPALNASVKYNLPAASAGTASFCTCSWASYNLISACIACQGFPEQISQWSVYSVGCAGLLSNTAFPTNITLPEDTSIPFWAGEDPTQWSSQTFNVGAAQQIASEGHPDITNVTAVTHKKSNNIGPIVGGVIGGLAILCGAITFGFWMLRRRRLLTQSGTSIMEKPNHMRSISDTTTASNLMSVGYTTLNSTSMPFTNPPSSPTMLTHTSSIRTIPNMSSMAGSVAPYGTASPPPRLHTAPPSNPEDIIRPFTLPPTHDPDRKQANGAYPVYDPPNAPPNTTANALRMELYRPVTPTQRARYNPPTYEESSASSSGRPGHRQNQFSSDTDLSLTSSPGNVTRGDRKPGASGSGVANIVNPSLPNALGQGHHSQLSLTRDQSNQPPPSPTDDGFSARDIA